MGRRRRRRWPGRQVSGVFWKPAGRPSSKRNAETSTRQLPNGRRPVARRGTEAAPEGARRAAAADDHDAARRRWRLATLQDSRPQRPQRLAPGKRRSHAAEGAAAVAGAAAGVLPPLRPPPRRRRPTRRRPLPSRNLPSHETTVKVTRDAGPPARQRRHSVGLHRRAERDLRAAGRKDQGRLRPRPSLSAGATIGAVFVSLTLPERAAPLGRLLRPRDHVRSRVACAVYGIPLSIFPPLPPVRARPSP